MLSDFPNPPSSSGLTTQTRSITLTTSTSLRQRRIRCKMCRHDLATREHLLDHGQLGPSNENPSECRPQSQPSPITKSCNLTNSKTLGHPSSSPTISQKINTGRDGELASDSNADIVSTPKDASNAEGKISDPIPAARSDPASSSDSVDPPSVTRSEDPSDLASELYTKLRIGPSSSSFEPSQQDSHLQQHISLHTSPPILINPKCSGYFVEPVRLFNSFPLPGSYSIIKQMKWMDHFLSAGSLSGKIICPNKKCNAKLGNYDWAGVCCGCKIWITPVCGSFVSFPFALIPILTGTFVFILAWFTSFIWNLEGKLIEGFFSLLGILH